MTPYFNVRLRKHILLSLFFAGLMLFTRGTAYAQEARNAFMDTAKNYLGTRYLTGGTSATGMDCSGLIYRAAIEGVNMQLPRTVSALSGSAQRITDSEREPGDLLFFNTTGTISHVGIWLGDGKFIHSASEGPKTGVIISSLSEEYWKRTYRFSGRIFKPTGLILASIPDKSENPDGRSEVKTDDDVLTIPFEEKYSFDGDMGFRLTMQGGVLWEFTNKRLPFRGGNAGVEISWMKGTNLYPGLFSGLTWDDRTASWSIPLMATVGNRWGFWFFAGTQFHLTAAETLSKAPVFPGIIGIAWRTPPLRMQSLKAQLFTSAEYSWFIDETPGTGFRFNTGMAISQDF